MTQDEINDTEWRDPANWHAGLLGIYRSPRDTRVLVPKRNPRWGWTVNLGKPAGAMAVLFLICLLTAFLVLAAAGM